MSEGHAAIDDRCDLAEAGFVARLLKVACLGQEDDEIHGLRDHDDPSAVLIIRGLDGTITQGPGWIGEHHAGVGHVEDLALDVGLDRLGTLECPPANIFVRH